MTDATTSSPPIKISWFFGILGAFLIFALIAAYSSRMANDTPGYDDQQAAIRIANLQKLQADDEKALTTADWIDQSKGTIRIPINEAMAREIKALKAKPVQMGAAIPGATPTPASAVTAGAPAASPSTNAAPAKPAAPNK
jgi:hypothetical protein